MENSHPPRISFRGAGHALFDDVGTARGILRASDTPYNRRTLFRTFFAAVEATMFMLKHIPLEAVARSPRLFTHAELSVLMEETPTLQENGTVTVRSRFEHIAANLRFLASALGRVSKRFPSVPVSHASWAAFQRSVRVRNRVVHPKRHADVVITDAELADLYAAEAWFRTWVNAVFKVATRRLKLSTERITRRVARLDSVLKGLRKVPPLKESG